MTISIHFGTSKGNISQDRLTGRWAMDVVNDVMWINYVTVRNPSRLGAMLGFKPIVKQFWVKEDDIHLYYVVTPDDN